MPPEDEHEPHVVDQFLDALDDYAARGGRITFSRYCRTGVLNEGEVCNCSRCRTARREPVTPESEAQAAIESEDAKKRLSEWVRSIQNPEEEPEEA